MISNSGYSFQTFFLIINILLSVYIIFYREFNINDMITIQNIFQVVKSILHIYIL